MIKVLKARCLDGYQVALTFSNRQEDVFDGHRLLQRTGPLLDPLRDEAYFRRLFIDAGAHCWPNGLELSPARLAELCGSVEVVH